MHTPADPAPAPAPAAAAPDQLARARAARRKGGAARRLTRYYVIGVFPDGRHDLLSECRSPQGARRYVETVGPLLARHYDRIAVLRGRDVTDRVLGAPAPAEPSTPVKEYQCPESRSPNCLPATRP